jgi:hypothetical protein
VIRRPLQDRLSGRGAARTSTACTPPSPRIPLDVADGIEGAQRGAGFGLGHGARGGPRTVELAG